MIYVFLKRIILILITHAGACRFKGQLFATLFSIVMGSFFFVVVPLNSILGISYSLEIINYNNFYFTVLIIIEVLLTCYFLLALFIGWLNLTNYSKKEVYYFRTFYFVIIAVTIFFVYIIIFAIDAFYYASPTNSIYESSVILDTFKLHKLVVITDSHPFYSQIKQFLQPKGADHGFYSFDVLPPNKKYGGEYNAYLASDVDELVKRLEEERELNRLKAEREYHIRMIRKIGISLTIGLWIVGWVLRNWDDLV